MELATESIDFEILTDFLHESLENLEGIEESILQLEGEHDPELVNSIFRAAHTIKGLASFLDLKNIGHLSHELESLLCSLRNDEIEVSKDLIDILLNGVDTLVQMLHELQEGITAFEAGSGGPVFFYEDVPYEKNLEAISELKRRNAEPIEKGAETEPKKRSTDPEEGDAKLLTTTELKSISYLMDMDVICVNESREHLEVLEQAFLDLENNTENFELYNDIFRALHSLKGGAGVLVSTLESKEHREKHPMTVFQKLAHSAEGLIQTARDSKKQLGTETFEIMFAVIDRFKNILDGFVNHDSSPAQADDLIATCLESNRSIKAATPPSGDKNTDATETEQAPTEISYAVQNTLTQSVNSIEMGLNELPNKEKRKGAVRKISRSLKNIIKVTKKIDLPALLESVDSMRQIVDLLSKEEIDNTEALISELVDAFPPLQQIVFNYLKISSEQAEKSAEPPIDEAEESAQKTEKPSVRAKKTAPVVSMIKVPQERLDVLMNLVGELIVSKNSFPDLAREITTEHNLIDLGKRVKSAGVQVSRITEDLQNIVMKMRMLPVGSVFNKFKRLVRDLAQKLDKKIVLKLSGEETELDKTIIEAIGDPMVHLIRNCADHALEGVAERIEKGKPPEGVIHIKAYNQGQNVVIEIIDDGRGIDPNYIRAKAIEKGYLTLEELESLDEKAIQNLIFRPGFSGAKKVTEVSGRGVGMDVVKTNIEQLDGTVTLHSTPGTGTTFVITLPLTLAVSKGLEVNAAGRHYYLPLDYIVETVKISPNQLHQHKNMQMALIRDTLLPVVSLAQLLGFGERATDAASKEASEGDVTDELCLVIMNMNGQKAALLVDCFYTESEYVIKPLSGSIANIPGYSGATITSKGEVILILDPLKLFGVR